MRSHRCRQSPGSASRLASVALGTMVLTTSATSWCRPYARLLHVRESGAERCPDAKELRSRIAERLGYDPFRQDASTSVRVGFRPDESGFTADVEAFDARSDLLGRRKLSSTDETCRDLADSVVLTVTLLLDTPPPGGIVSTPHPKDLPAAVESPHLGVAPLPVKVLWTVDVGLDLVAAVGYAPSPSVGTRLAVGLRHGPWSFALGGRLDLPAEGRFATGTVETAVRLGELSGCGHFGRGFLCVVGAAGAITADGRNVLNARRTIGPFGTVGGRVGGDIPLVGPLALRGSAELVALLVRTSVMVGQETLFTTPALGGTFAIGFVGRFP
jgi:hypothetical protein